MNIYVNPGNALEFTKDGTDANSFVRLGTTGLEKVSAATELTKTGVHRTVVKVEIPYTIASPEENISDQPSGKVVSVHLVINCPEKAPLGDDPSGTGYAYAQYLALSYLTTILTGESVLLDQATDVAKKLASVYVRGQVGVAPLSDDMEFGDPDAP